MPCVHRCTVLRGLLCTTGCGRSGLVVGCCGSAMFQLGGGRWDLPPRPAAVLVPRLMRRALRLHALRLLLLYNHFLQC